MHNLYFVTQSIYVLQTLLWAKINVCNQIVIQNLKRKK